MLMNEPQAGGAALGALLRLFLSSIQRRRQFAKASARVVFEVAKLDLQVFSAPARTSVSALP